MRRTPPYLRQPRLLEGLHRVRGAAPHSWLLHHALHRGAPHMARAPLGYSRYPSFGN